MPEYLSSRNNCDNCYSILTQNFNLTFNSLKICNTFLEKVSNRNSMVNSTVCKLGTIIVLTILSAFSLFFFFKKPLLFIINFKTKFSILKILCCYRNDNRSACICTTKV